jgi:hypothetical protein
VPSAVKGDVGLAGFAAGADAFTRIAAADAPAVARLIK